MLKKINSPEKIERLKVTLYLKEKGKIADLDTLFKLLKDEDWNVRNASAQALLTLIERYPILKDQALKTLHNLIKESSLSVKLPILEVLGKLKDYKSKPYLQKLLEESDYDLLYAAVRAIGFLTDVDILASLKNVVYAKDYITRRAALLSVIRIVNAIEPENRVKVLASHIHLLMEVYLELNELGDIICEILDYGDPQDFPEMKGYNEYEIVKLEELLERKDYSVEMYRNFSKLIYPQYFLYPHDQVTSQ